MMTRWLLTALFMGSVAGGQNTSLVDTPAVEYSFTQPCDVIRPAALTYFQKEALSLAANPQCEGCLVGSTKRLHDEAGHRLFSNRNVIRRYTTYDLRYHKVGPVTQIVHWDMRMDAHMHFQPEDHGCRAFLHFGYGWYGAYLVLGFPVDGDGEGAYSNGKLETAYLHTLQQQIDHASVVSLSGPIHSVR